MSAWPLAGRERETAQFDAVWAQPHCWGVMLFGGPGSGTSRLAEELLARAARGPWRGSRVVATDPGAPLAAMRHLVPEGADLSDPVRGFAAVARAMADPAGRRQALLVDDLHLLDTASAVVIQYLLNVGVARLIGSVRTGEPFTAAVHALAQGNAMHRIDVAPFGTEQTEAVLRGALGGPVDRRTLRTLCTASGGNAFYLRELVRGALADGSLRHDGEIWALAPGAPALPPALSGLIRTRLAAAPPGARAVLELLALASPVALADARAVAGPAALSGLDDLGLIRIRQDGRRTTVTLAHPLYGATLRGGLPPRRRHEILLGHLARIRARPARRRDDGAELAKLLLATTGTADPALLVPGALTARHAHDYRQVEAMTEALPEQARTVPARMMHGEALMNMARWREADGVFRAAQVAAVTERERATALLGRTSSLFWAAGRTTQALRASAAAMAEPWSPGAYRLIRLNHAAMLVTSGRPGHGLELMTGLDARPAVPAGPAPAAGAAPAPETAVWEIAAFARTAGLTFTGRSREAVSWGRRVHAAHQRLADRRQAARTPHSQVNPLIMALADAGRLGAARELAEQALAELVEADVALPRVWTACFLGRVEWLAGDAAAARRWYAEAVAQARAHAFLPPLRTAWAGLAASAAVLGDTAAARTAAAAMHGCPPMGAPVGEDGLAEAWLLAAQGRAADARQVLRRAALRARHTGHTTAEMLLLTDIARLGGAAGVVHRLTTLGTVCDGPLAAARVHLAAALAADDAAPLAAAADEWARLEARLVAAEAAFAAAAAWRRAGRTRQATAAARQARACAEKCPGARTPLLAAAPTEPAGPLTRREREIAQLAADGHSSRSIADTLHLSVRTIDNHLQHAYTKLGVTSRSRLPAALDIRDTPTSAQADRRLGGRRRHP